MTSVSAAILDKCLGSRQSKMLSCELMLLKPCEHIDAPLYIGILNTI